MVKSFFLVWVMIVAGIFSPSQFAFSQFPDFTKAMDTTDGVCFSRMSGDLICVGSGIDDPASGGGVAAPIGSVYHRTNGITYKKTGVGNTAWVIQGLESPVVSQTADFGKNGVSSANSWLNRAGSVPSNTVGIPVTLASGVMQSVYCDNANTVSGDVEIYEHDGTTFTLLYTLTFSSSHAASATSLAVSVTKGKMIAVKNVVALSNPGCTVAMKGTSL